MSRVHMTAAFAVAWARHIQHWNRPLPPDEQEFRKGWNAAIAAAEVVIQYVDVSPGDLTRGLEVEVKT